MQPPQRCERRTMDGAEDNIVPHSQYAQAIIDLPEVFNNEQSNVDRAGQYTHDSSFHSFILGSDPNANFVGFYSNLQEKCVLPADTEIGSISPLSNLFKKAMEKIGVKSPLSGIGTTMAERLKIAKEVGEYSLIIRPTFTLGGTELGGIAYNKEEFETICNAGLAANITSQVLVKKSLLGWKKYELEVMRDLADNVVIINREY